VPHLAYTLLILFRDDDFRENKLMEEDIPFIQDELDNVTTIMYLVIEGVRNDPVTLESPRGKLRMYSFLTSSTN